MKLTEKKVLVLLLQVKFQKKRLSTKKLVQALPGISKVVLVSLRFKIKLLRIVKLPERWMGGVNNLTKPE